MNNEARLRKATFAGGCFWCLQPPFDKLEGVIATIPGYMGGKTDNPTYQEVCSGSTGHAEVIQVEFDPQQVDYADLLEVFWRNINPTDAGGQFVDRGSQYRSAIFYHDQEQKRIAEESRLALNETGRFQAPIVTEVVPAGPFFPAEDYHQDYYRKSPMRYRSYRYHSGRDRFLDQVWDDESETD